MITKERAKPTAEGGCATRVWMNSISDTAYEDQEELDQPTRVV